MVQLYDRDAEAVRQLLQLVAGFVDTIGDEAIHDAEIMPHNWGWFCNRILEFGSPGLVGEVHAPVKRSETVAWLKSIVAAIEEQQKPAFGVSNA